MNAFKYAVKRSAAYFRIVDSRGDEGGLLTASPVMDTNWK